MTKYIGIIAALLLHIQSFGQGDNALFTAIQKHGSIDTILVDKHTTNYKIDNANKKVLLINRESKKHMVTDDAFITLENVNYVAKMKNIKYDHPALKNLPTNTDIYLIDYPISKTIISNNNDALQNEANKLASFTVDRKKNNGSVQFEDGSTVEFTLDAPFIKMSTYEVILELDKLIKHLDR